LIEVLAGQTDIVDLGGCLQTVEDGCEELRGQQLVKGNPRHKRQILSHALHFDLVGGHKG